MKLSDLDLSSRSKTRIVSIDVPGWQRRRIDELLREERQRRQQEQLAAVLGPRAREISAGMRELARTMGLTARMIAKAFQVPLRLLLTTSAQRAQREKRQVQAMQRWARRRGRRKGRA